MLKWSYLYAFSEGPLEVSISRSDCKSSGQEARHEQGAFPDYVGDGKVVVFLGMIQTHAAYALECVDVSDHWKVKHILSAQRL